MGSTTFILICAAEVVAALLFTIALLLLKNRKLQRLMKKLQAKTEAMRTKLKALKTSTQEPITPSHPTESYRDKLTQQLEITKNHHYQLGSRHDISLDLDPDSPLPRRTAALRNAFLIAEKEASSDATEEINWDFLATRYQQLLSYNDDYTSDDEQETQENLEQLKEELEQQKKRIKNLDRFKKMYFELEERWSKCKSEADTHYSELKSFAAASDQKDNIELVLESYQASYQEIGQIIEAGSPTEAETASSATLISGQSDELDRLRTVTADQHRIINDLKDKLSSASDAEEQLEIMDTMQVELQKQARFLQESETCIQLMDNELSTANKELEQLRSKVKELPQLRASVKDLQNTTGTQEQIADSLKHENKRLAKKLKIATEAPPEDSQEARQLRKELTTMQANYNDLEERFLDLKTQG